MATYTTSDSTFDQDVVSNEITTIVDFWAEWCGPCKQIGPILDEISEEKKDQIKILKLNIDDNPVTPQKYGVRGIPTLMIFQKGKLVDTKVGSLPKSALNDWINNNL
jgi:thioredoxin 1|tara:strand:- start:688 stop:1008 length:321 start_codon:yes stop_codon:yes gene_type:complete